MQCVLMVLLLIIIIIYMQSLPITVHVEKLCEEYNERYSYKPIYEYQECTPGNTAKQLCMLDIHTVYINIQVLYVQKQSVTKTLFYLLS